MLLIHEPIPFYCQSDEDHFFGWLQSIPAVKSVTGAPNGLEVSIQEPIDKTSFYELVGLMTRYNLDRRRLKPLCEFQTDPWFKDEKNYWYKSVFGF